MIGHVAKDFPYRAFNTIFISFVRSRDSTRGTRDIGSGAHGGGQGSTKSGARCD